MKKFTALFLAVLMLVSCFSFSMAANDTGSSFSDMPPSTHWSYNALQKAIENGLLAGSNGKINPTGLLTRAEMAAIVVKAFGATVSTDISGYTDVKPSDWFYDWMAKAVHMGAMKGSDNKLRPNDPITREEAFTVFANLLKLPEATTLNVSFSDADDISIWARKYVYAMVNAGYVSGSGGKINPKSNITRESFAALFDNVIKYYIESTKDQTYNGNVMLRTYNITLENVTINGDLIIGDGVAKGTVTLKNVKVTGRVLVRGGILVTFDVGCEVKSILSANINDQTTFSAADGINIDDLIVAVGSQDIFTSGGTIRRLSILGPNTVVYNNGPRPSNIITQNIVGSNSRVINPSITPSEPFKAYVTLWFKDGSVVTSESDASGNVVLDCSGDGRDIIRPSYMDEGQLYDYNALANRKNIITHARIVTNKYGSQTFTVKFSSMVTTYLPSGTTVGQLNTSTKVPLGTLFSSVLTPEEGTKYISARQELCLLNMKTIASKYNTYLNWFIGNTDWINKTEQEKAELFGGFQYHEQDGTNNAYQTLNGFVGVYPLNIKLIYPYLAPAA